MRGFLYIIMIVALHSAAAFADDAATPATGLSVKAGVIGFRDPLVDVNGPYVGIEVFSRVSESVSVGGQASFGMMLNRADDLAAGSAVDDLTYIPVELNVRYSVPLGEHILAGLDAGVSLNGIVEKKQQCGMILISLDPVQYCSTTTTQLLRLGAQVGLTVDVTSGTFRAGLDGTYQATDGDDSAAGKYSNYRLGVHAGWLF